MVCSPWPVVAIDPGRSTLVLASRLSRSIAHAAGAARGRLSWSDTSGIPSCSLGHAGHDPGGRAGKPLQDCRAFRRRRARRLDAGRPGHQPANHGPGRTAAVERGRGDGPGLRRSGSAGLRAGARAGRSTPLPPATSRAMPWWPSPPAACNISPAKSCKGVIGHEFSHILNGDMRLNLRLIGMVYGILFWRSSAIISCGRPACLLGDSRRDNGAAAASCSSAWRWSSWAIWACSWAN